MKTICKTLEVIFLLISLVLIFNFLITMRMGDTVMGTLWYFNALAGSLVASFLVSPAPLNKRVRMLLLGLFIEVKK